MKHDRNNPPCGERLRSTIRMQATARRLSVVSSTVASAPGAALRVAFGKQIRSASFPLAVARFGTFCQDMRRALLTLLTLLACTTVATADIPGVPESLSPDGKIHAVMDVDRDPKISPEWKEDSFPRIEITQKATGQVLASIEYFGSAGDDTRPLREHVRVNWRPDSKVFAITIDDRFYSASKVFAMTRESKFVEVAFPSYTAMTGFPVPDSDQSVSYTHLTLPTSDLV